MKWHLALTGLVAGVVACSAFGPSRTPPPAAPPARYSVGQEHETLPSADAVAQRLMLGARPVPQWWQAYGSAQLDQLVEEGLRASPSLKAAQSSLRAAREGLRSQIGDSMLPRLDAVFSPERERSLGLPILPQQPTFQYSAFVAQVQASYTFDFFGAAFLANRALAGQIRQQVWQLEATRRALATNIVVASINVASLQEQLEAMQRLVDLGEERARQLDARYQAGSATRDEALTAEQDAANAAAALPALRAQLAAMRHGQAVLLGRTPDHAPAPLPLDSLKIPATVPVAVPSELLHQRPDILAAEAAVQSAADAAGAATASLFPSLSLTASYGRGAFDWTQIATPAGVVWGVGGSLTQPLFHGGALRARKRQYEAQYDTAVAQYQQTVLSAFRNVADTLASLEEDANTVIQTQRAEVAAHAEEGNTDSRYKLGATSYYITLTASQQYLNAHMQLIRARAARLTDSAALFDSMGEPPVGREAQSAAR